MISNDYVSEEIANERFNELHENGKIIIGDKSMFEDGERDCNLSIDDDHDSG